MLKCTLATPFAKLFDLSQFKVCEFSVGLVFGWTGWTGDWRG